MTHKYTDRQKITVLSDSSVGPSGVDRLHGHADIALAWDETSLRKALPGSEILLVTDFNTEALRTSWASADSLQWIHAASAGVDKLIFDELVQSNVLVTNAQGLFDRNISEYVLAQILMFAKDSKKNIVYQQKHRWLHRDSEIIENSRILIVGAGSIGHKIGSLCQSIGMHVTGIARTAKDSDDVFGAIYAHADLDKLLPNADYVVVVAPLTRSTEGLFDSRRLSLMANHARIINVGRGPIVVTQDLVSALSRGEIAGAALDVFEVEPLPSNHPLWDMDNVLISPHMAGDFIGWPDAIIDQFLVNLDLWHRGEELPGKVNKTLGYTPPGRS